MIARMVGPHRGNLVLAAVFLKDGDYEAFERVLSKALDDALAQPQPGPETVYFGVYSPDVDPTGEQFDTEDDPHDL